MARRLLARAVWRACEPQASASRVSGGRVDDPAEEAETVRARGRATADLDGGEVHLERAGRVQLVHDRPEQLRVHIVDLALEDHNLLRV